eukprot:10310-Heterococcus_DN1.PRE.1
MKPQQAHSIISKMMINQELCGSWDQPTETIVLQKVEPSRLQMLALQFANKLEHAFDVMCVLSSVVLTVIAVLVGDDYKLTRYHLLAATTIPTTLQASSLVESNERLLDARTGNYGYRDDKWGNRDGGGGGGGRGSGGGFQQRDNRDSGGGRGGSGPRDGGFRSNAPPGGRGGTQGGFQGRGGGRGRGNYIASGGRSNMRFRRFVNGAGLQYATVALCEIHISVCIAIHKYTRQLHITYFIPRWWSPPFACCCFAWVALPKTQSNMMNTTSRASIRQLCALSLYCARSLFAQLRAMSWKDVAAQQQASVVQAAQGEFIVIRDATEVARKRSKVVAEGAHQAQAIVDFDYTLTRFHLNGKQGCSCHAVIGQCGLLTDAYHHLSTSLHAKYYPLEVDRSLSLEDRIKFMVEWVEQSHAAMLTSGLTRSKLISAVADANIALRDGHDVLLSHLEALSIPLLIFSAGIADVLEEVFKQHSEAPLPQHAHIVSNRMVFNEQSGALEGFTEDLFHVFNKQASSIQHAPYFQADGIDKRHNVILLGDSLGDVHMATSQQGCTMLTNYSLSYNKAAQR